MKVARGLSAGAIRTLARELTRRLEQAGSVPCAQPGRLFFPKRLHELSAVEGEAPDGLGADYVDLAVRLNASAAPAAPLDLLTLLLRTVETEIAHARRAEARLIDALEGAA